MFLKRNQLVSLAVSAVALSVGLALPCLAHDYVEAKTRIHEQFGSVKKNSAMDQSVRKRIIELQRSVAGTEKHLLKGGLSNVESEVLGNLYQQLGRQINFTGGENVEKLLPVSYEKTVISELTEDSEKQLARSGPLDNKFYLLRFKVDTGIFANQLSDKDAQFFNDEIIRLKRLEDDQSDKNGMMPIAAKESISRAIDLLDLDLKLRVTEGPFAKVVGARQLKTTCRPSAPPPAYSWYPSKLGGYIEATGQINGRFTKETIAQYGGVIHEDGKAIPVSSKQAIKTTSNL